MLGAKEMDSSVPVVNPSRSGAREENEKLPEAKHRDQAKQKRQKRRPTQPVSAKDVREAMEGPEVNISVLCLVVCFMPHCLTFTF